MKTMTQDGEHVIVSDDILAFDPNTGVGAYAMCLSGSFTYPSGQAPCSILINNGKDICSAACHAWLGYPEAVIYRYKNGAIGMGRFKYTKEIPNRSDVLWAVGGMGLMNYYKPALEGFTTGTRPDGKRFNYTDVLRRTAHTVLGIKDGKCHLIYIHNKTGYQVSVYMKTHGYEKAIMLDGGHIAAINAGNSLARHNLYTRQGYALQAIDRELKQRPLVVWDAGHNALNPTNRSPEGDYLEWEHNIDVVKQAMALLTNWGVDSMFVDVLEPSQSVELRELVQRINRTGAAICVSVHTNAASSRLAQGQEIYCYKMAGESFRLAQCLHEEMKVLGMRDRGIKDGSHLYVVRETTMACALVETGFHTNQEDLAKLKSTSFREQEARALAMGVMRYFKLQK